MDPQAAARGASSEAHATERGESSSFGARARSGDRWFLLGGLGTARFGETEGVGDWGE